MKAKALAKLKMIALALILPGLAGLIASAMVSVHYLDTMPRWPSPQESRIVPRNIHGIIVFQTETEDRNLNLLEYCSIGVFAVGLGLGLVYLEKWRLRQSSAAEESEQFSRYNP